jgi:hypothetical protein
MPDQVELEAKVATALAALGDTETAVADTLRTAGAHGFRCSMSRCPIANYLTSHDDLGLIAAFISAEGITVVTPDGTDTDFIIPSPAVAAFVTEFDRGEHADLCDGVNLGWQNLTLQHEAERLEGQPPSPVNARMKQIVNAELRERQEADRA